MKNEDQITGWIREAERGIERIRARNDLHYPELQISELKAQIEALKWVLEEKA